MKRWREHTPFTRPGRFAAELIAHGPSIGAAVETVQGLLIHGGALELYGLTESIETSRETLTVEARLEDLDIRLISPVLDSRPAAARLIGTCRDFALLLCAIMRSQAVPARVRCGFASYFGEAPWEDHWICEVWMRDRWRRVDAQLDSVHRDWFGITFDCGDLPQDIYLTADEAWRGARLPRPWWI
ncbi:transglutaminase domain-containing protein [Phenylobacterium sp.]|uniref:transglutaminase domain-containing protein n=1 Tax=Phenylobacterium sp. TaxID=1871053 RepID=UPI0037CBF83E